MQLVLILLPMLKYLTQVAYLAAVQSWALSMCKVRKDLIGITQSDKARDPSLPWKLMTHTSPSFNKQLLKSRVRVHFLSFLCAIHTQSKQILRFSGIGTSQIRLRYMPC